MYFKKTDRVKSIFNVIDFIKNNYTYYQQLYEFRPNNYFRNDYALSIAIHMLNSQLEDNAVKSLPIKTLIVATEHDDMIDFKNGTAYFVSERQQGDFKLHKLNTNVHVMNKWSIGRMAERIIKYATDK
jgi:esterase/lipase